MAACALPPDASPQAIDAFVAHWQDREGGQERANYQLFLVGLCRLLGLPEPSPAEATHERNDYVFERMVRKQGDEDETIGRIDLYRRDCFVLEAKQSRLKGGDKEVMGQAELFALPNSPATRGRRGASRAWDVLMLNAKLQAQEYAKALPTNHGWPPFLLVCDVGHCIEVFADFSGQGKNYTQFPDRQGFRIYLEDLRNAEVRDRLRRIWLDPHSLDQTRKAAKATREMAQRLAAVSKALEAKNHDPEDVALFLMRCLFTMFAEDVKLLPEESFKGLLQECAKAPDKFVPLLSDLWHSMNEGEFAPSIRAKVLKFNGNLFASAKVLPLAREEIGELAAAAAKDWREVEPAIFGTLLEQALDRKERKRLGAHYTPRTYVERLVIATVIDPLREDWRMAQAAAETLRAAGDLQGAASVVQTFHEQLCATRVLDPACGTGNFLYVAMLLMKKLEDDVLDALASLLSQQRFVGYEPKAIGPHQFLGLEKNARAAAIAELVLWIGYLQLHFSTRGGTPPEPILRNFKNIWTSYDAVLTWDGYPVVHVVGGKEAYPNARRPSWPEAEFIIGNPPFIGGKDLRERLGDAYAEALWSAHRHMNESADFVMYWWDRAAEILTAKGSRLRRFGFVTTNSITQDFSRRVIKKRLDGKQPVSLLMAIPDHPWTKATPDAAAVRIAMTVVGRGEHEGVRLEVVREGGLETDTPATEFVSRAGRINADLTVGSDVASAQSLLANTGLASRGMSLHGSDFIVTRSQAEHLGLRRRPGLERHIREYRNGRDLTGRPRGVLAIDLFGLDADEVRERYPEVYQHVLATVKPERDRNNREAYRTNWWLFGEPRRELRPALQGIPRYLATVETAKHRVFQFLSADVLPDNMLVCVATEDAWHLGVLSSSIHRTWALRAGGWLGIGNDPRYSKSKVFDPFPFPAASDGLKAAIRAAAEELDAFRKRRQAEHSGLTLTGIYNVLEKLKAGAALDPDEERVKDEGLILILQELQERLDRLVFRAYGWPETVSDEEILARLVALNKERATEEKRGLVRWLRPDYQIPRYGRPADKQAAAEEGAQISATLHVLETVQKPSFPQTGFEQSAAVFAALAASVGPVDAAGIAASFKQGRRIEPKVAAVLASLARLGHISTSDGGRSFSLRRVA